MNQHVNADSAVFRYKWQKYKKPETGQQTEHDEKFLSLDSGFSKIG